MSWKFIAIVLLLAHREYMASPTPMKLPGHTQRLTPFIRHWEAANFDRVQLQDAHQKHIEQKHHRRKRDLNAGEYGPVHTIRLQFFAHDREFRLVLRQDPLSVFTGDVEIENTLGPMDYDISRIYTGSLEDDENSHVHAILTSDNLLDGTIETSSEQYYLEPSQRYSRDLHGSGIHSIVYKVSDVSDTKDAAAASSMTNRCASERLRRKQFESPNKNQYKDNNSIMHLHRRKKRWLPDELSASDDRQNPPMPLDLDVPYNDDFGIFSRTNTKTFNDDQELQRNVQQSAVVITSRNSVTNERDIVPIMATTSTTTARNRNIIVNNPESENSNNNNYVRKTYTKHKNIIVSTYNNNNNNNNNNYNNNRSPTMERPNEDQGMSLNSNSNNYNENNSPNNFFNTNWTTMFVGNNDRPSHKTHVEIITKNGATKKPNIIVNTYNPDIVLAPNPHNPPNYNSAMMTNLLSGRGDGSTDSSAGNVRSLYDRKITCMLYLQADHTFFQKMGSDEASIEAITRHVQRANSIYKNTDFNNDGKPDNITFMIKRIKVHNMQAIKDPAYRFPGNYGVEKFLELFSEEDYDAFCLAYMFTYRDFEMGTLGLAWTGDLKNAGGVCEKNGHYRGSLKSLNTGIVTLLNYGKHVPPAVSHVTLAHEIGHNFGSPHDPEQCTPGGEDGNFIMFARATSGDKKNNNKFSPCSLKSIEPVLNAKARSIKGCFTEPQTSICGNGVVEPGEQCDCGWEEDCKDSCCFPMSRHARVDEKPCTLTPHAMCSPSQGPCCTTDCKLKFGDKCRDDNGCRDPSFCNGHMPQCPPSVNKPNKTICNKEFVCYMGDCTGSICLAYGLESCQCIPGPKDDKIKSCELCCKLQGEENPCRSSFEWNEAPFDVPDMYAKPGTPCNDYNGYCDVFQKCREVDPSGPLATLRKLLLSEESIASFKKWMQQNWYSVALAMVGVFVLLILSTKLLAKRSNLKLKSVTIIHSATTETVRLPDDNNGVIVHTAVRTKVPFKKKVRGERSNGGGAKGKSSTSKTTKASQVLTRNTKVKLPSSPSGAAPCNEAKKSKRNKKNRVAGATSGQIAAEAAVGADITNTEKSSNDSKRVKKFKKYNNNNKEIIDYSSRNNSTSAAAASGGHTNTFGKVQKWLLESPIVAQPLSHIDHSVKARSKIMSKSQSTPERLVQKSPQKTKSLGNLAANEKVKLQVVYKPPFKFSLRLSKNSKVKTHVVSTGGNAVNKLKRLSRTSGTADGKRQSVESTKGSSAVEKTKRAALLLRTNTDEDNQILTLNEPNYETLNTKLLNTPSKVENPFYENMQYTQLSAAGSNDGPKMSRSSSRVNLDTKQQSQRPRTYSRSNSLSTTTNNPFAVTQNRTTAARKLSESNSTNLNRNFGSTQNLINSSQNNLAKSKKRSSLNLKSSNARGGKDLPAKRSNSNMNLRRDSSATNMSQQDLLPLTKTPSTTTNARKTLQRCSSGTDQQQLPTQPPVNSTITATNIQPKQQLPTYSTQRHARASFSNIPRACLANNNSPPTTTTTNSTFGRQNGSSGTEQRRNRNVVTHQRTNSIRQHAHNHHPPPLPTETDVNNAQQRELPSDLEVMVSDVENLVS